MVNNFLAEISGIMEDHKNIVIVGDANIDLLDDHRLITFTINLPSHSTKQVNDGKLKNDLQSKLKCMRQQEMNFGKLTEIITEETLKYTALRTRNHTTNISDTRELKELIKERDKKYVFTWRYPNTHRFEVEFADLQRRVKNLIEYNKKEHFESKLKDCEGSMKKTWDKTKEMTGQCGERNHCDIVMNYGKKII
ncbi:hypothetical protein HHI36_005457 [Cryptolaemus montrouzieri]|uniref:Endonuclease/exonuclease/phosphatase domain-containing protein n=1 Tax=Cryptolaemus montrouzieri TaxID=559131 RepID=A0ABD2NV88_9CUCU